LCALADIPLCAGIAVFAGKTLPDRSTGRLLGIAALIAGAQVVAVLDDLSDGGRRAGAGEKHTCLFLTFSVGSTLAEHDGLRVHLAHFGHLVAEQGAVAEVTILFLGAVGRLQAAARVGSSGAGAALAAFAACALVAVVAGHGFGNWISRAQQLGHAVGLLVRVGANRLGLLHGRRLAKAADGVADIAQTGGVANGGTGHHRGWVQFAGRGRRGLVAIQRAVAGVTILQFGAVGVRRTGAGVDLAGIAFAVGALITHGAGIVIVAWHGRPTITHRSLGFAVAGGWVALPIEAGGGFFLAVHHAAGGEGTDVRPDVGVAEELAVAEVVLRRRTVRILVARADVLATCASTVGAAGVDLADVGAETKLAFVHRCLLALPVS